MCMPLQLSLKSLSQISVLKPQCMLSSVFELGSSADGLALIHASRYHSPTLSKINADLVSKYFPANGHLNATTVLLHSN